MPEDFNFTQHSIVTTFDDEDCKAPSIKSLDPSKSIEFDANVAEVVFVHVGPLVKVPFKLLEFVQTFDNVVPLPLLQV